MKPILMFISLLVLGCTKPRPVEDNRIISVLNDKTDHLELVPTAKPLLSYLKLAEHKEGSCLFKYKEITDKVLSPITSIYLPPKVETEKQNNGTVLHREKAIQRFSDSITRFMDNQTGQVDTGTIAYTECFKAVCQELNELRDIPATQRTVLLFSNCFEHSAILNCYQEHSPSWQKILQAFEHAQLLQGNYPNTTMIIVFKPTTRIEDGLFSQVGKAYTELCLKHGIKVHIQAQNNQYPSP